MIDDLQVLGQAVALGESAPPETKAQIESLQKKLPAAFVAHLLRSIACGRRGVALVRHGVCCECHIRVASATLHSLARPGDLHLCESCGCFLKLDPADVDIPVSSPVPMRVFQRVYRRRTTGVRRARSAVRSQVPGVDVTV